MSDRLRQLVALATNPATTEEEARTTALVACRLIMKEQLLDKLCTPVSSTAAPLRKHVGATRRPINPAPPSPSPSSPPPAPTAPAPPATLRRVMKSKYPGSCHVCHKDYAPGDPIAWAKHHPTIHAKCDERHEPHDKVNPSPARPREVKTTHQTPSRGRSSSEYGRPKPSGQAKFTW